MMQRGGSGATAFVRRKTERRGLVRRRDRSGEALENGQIVRRQLVAGCVTDLFWRSRKGAACAHYNDIAVDSSHVFYDFNLGRSLRIGVEQVGAQTFYQMWMRTVRIAANQLQRFILLQRMIAHKLAGNLSSDRPRRADD